ncbi:MAG: hypothetical protein QXR96_02420 [Candidatus Woesearchaeota archaeon]
MNFADLSLSVLMFLKEYYNLLLSLNVSSFSTELKNDEKLYELLSKKPDFKEDMPLPLDVFPELFLAFGTEIQKNYPSFSKNFNLNRDLQGLISLYSNLGNVFFTGEETGKLFDKIESESSKPEVIIFVDSIDGSKRMEETLHKQESTLERAINSLLKENQNYGLITNSPSTGITIYYKGQVIFSMGLNLFTGEAIGSYFNGNIIIPFYIPNIRDFSSLTDLKEPVFSDLNGLNFLCYNGNKGYSKQNYQQNLEQTGLSALNLINHYTTGPLRIAYLLSREEIQKLVVQIIASNREKIHDMGNSLSVALASKELCVFVLKAEQNYISENGILTLPNEIEDPRNIRMTYVIFNKKNKEAIDFFNKLREQSKGFYLSN